jgi:hypothetical protein
LSIYSWFGKGHKLDRSNASWTIGSFLALLFPTEGILIMALSGQTIVQGVGIIYESNAFLIGYPFVALGINTILAWHIYKHEYFQNDHNRNLLDLMFLFCQGLLIAGGLMIIARAATLIIDGVGTLSESIVTLFGAQMVILGLLTLSCWILRKDGSTRKYKRVLTLGLLFLILMVPPAFII